MRAALVVLLTLLVTAFAGGVARADVHASKTGKASVTIPKKWTVINESDELVRAVSPDGQVALVFWITEPLETKDAIKKLESELYSSIQGLRWVDKVKKLKINGIAATWVEGVGVNAKSSQLDVLVVVAGPTRAKKGVLMFAAVEHENLGKHRKSIQQIFQSLRLTK